MDCLEDADRNALERVFAGLGSGGSQAQEALMNEAEAELSRLLDDARKKRREQHRLYTSLGALGGMALAILLV